MNNHHFFITGRKEPAADNQCLVEFGKQYCYTNYEYDNIAVNYEYEKRKNYLLRIFITRSYAALRAVDLDWIVRPGYSLGREHSGERQ